MRNAGWSVSNIISERRPEERKREGFQALIDEGGPVADKKLLIEDLQKHTDDTQRISKLFGADLFGVTGLAQ